MRDEGKTKKDLINELSQLCQRIAELESTDRGTVNELACRKAMAAEGVNTDIKDSRAEDALLSDIFIKAQEQEEKASLMNSMMLWGIP